MKAPPCFFTFSCFLPLCLFLVNFTSFDQNLTKPPWDCSHLCLFWSISLLLTKICPSPLGAALPSRQHIPHKKKEEPHDSSLLIISQIFPEICLLSLLFSCQHHHCLHQSVQSHLPWMHGLLRNQAPSTPHWLFFLRQVIPSFLRTA